MGKKKTGRSMPVFHEVHDLLKVQLFKSECTFFVFLVIFEDGNVPRLSFIHVKSAWLGNKLYFIVHKSLIFVQSYITDGIITSRFLVFIVIHITACETFFICRCGSKSIIKIAVSVQ